MVAMRFKVKYCQIIMISLVIGTGRFIYGQNENDTTEPLYNSEEINTTARSMVGANERSEPKLNEYHTDGSVMLAETTKSSNYDYAKVDSIEKLVSTSGKWESVATELMNQNANDAETEFSITESVADVGYEVISSDPVLLTNNPIESHGNPVKRESKDTRPPNFTSNRNSCNLAEDNDPNFVITKLSPNDVKFEWRQPKCTKSQKKVNSPVSHYDIVIRRPNQENYTFGFGGDARQGTISSGSYSTIERKIFTFIPCASYQAVLKVVWPIFETDEHYQEFVVPLSNPLEPYRKIQEKTGPGWISLTWEMSRACTHNLSLIKLAISGGRDNPTSRTLELPLESCATWDSKDSQVTLKLTNSHQKCLKDWRWEPCTRYNLSLTPIFRNSQINASPEVRTTVLGIRTPVEDPETDAKVQDLQIVDKGSDWLLLRWKAPYCLQESGKAYTFLIPNTDTWRFTQCPETPSLDTVSSNSPNGGKHYHVHNITQCPLLASCTTVQIRVRNDFNDPAIAGTSQKRADISGSTLPPSIEQFTIESPSPSQLKLRWRISACPNYPLLKYSLALKADTQPATHMTMDIDPECTEFGIGQEKKVCGAQHMILPCTNYEFQLTPLFNGNPDKENGTHISFFTKFPAKGEYYDVKIGEVGSQWAVLNITLHPQCFRYVESLLLTLIDDRSLTTYLTAPSNCLPQNTMNGALLLNLTYSQCFPDFPGFQSCNGHYSLKALPTLGLVSRKFGQPSQIETRTKLLRDDPTSILNATVTARGSLWISLAWTPPTCQELLSWYEPYTLALYENNEANNPCLVTINSRNISTTNVSSVWCTSGKQMHIKPCTEYLFQVKAQFYSADMNRKANWTRSNTERTLPDPSQSYVQNLNVSNVSTTQALLSWKPPMCNHFVQNYGLKLSDSSAGGKEVLFTVVPLSCSTGRDKLYWPNDKCETSIYSKGNNVQLEPCTDYIAKVWPRQNDEKGSLLTYAEEEIYFTTKPARPGKIGFLSVTHINTNVTVNWRNTTQNARCLQGFKVMLAETGGSVLEIGLVDKDKDYYHIANLKPCTSYQITVQSFGETGSENVTSTFSMEESPPGPPRNLTCPSLDDTGVSLAWSPPESYVECVHLYHVEIFQVGPNETKTYYRSQSCMDTKIYCAGLESSTRYEFRVTARTQKKLYSSPEALIVLSTTQAEGNLSSMALTFIIILVFFCSAFLILLTYWCYVRQPWNLWLTSCYAKESVFIRHRSPSYSRARGGGTGQAGDRASRSSRRVSRHSLRNYGTNRPIPLQHFDKVLQELLADTCALLGEEYEDVKLLSNENQPKTWAAMAENKIKNRYLNILPYDHSRVQLKSVDGDEHGDYINASFIQGFNGAKEYIAAQGPKPITVPDFWRMIWEQDVRVLVMVTQVEEHGKIKCAQYWPDSKENLTYGNIHVSQVLQVAMDDYVIRDLEVDCDGSKRVVKQMHFLTWPDFGCPQNPETLLSFIEAVRDRVSSLSEAGPILVHCSAGVGRTGTFIAVDWLTQESRVNSQVDVFNTVLKLRSDRMNMVQTEDQYLFIHHCLSHFLKTRLRANSPLASSIEPQPDCEQPKMSNDYNPSLRVLHSSQANLAESAM